MKVFDGLEIRDTEAKNSLVYETAIPGKAKLIVYKNMHDQAVSLQLQGTLDKAFSDPIDIESPILPILAAASMGSPKYEWLTEPWQYLRMKATCSVAPESGRLDVWIK